jgi:hypothetical protein
MLRLLLPALVPSWRFFDRIGPAPRVELALVGGSSDDSPTWREVHPRPARVSFGVMLARLFWNHRRNESLYLVSCAERLVDDPTEQRALQLWRRVVDTAISEMVVGEPSGHAFLRVRIVETHRQHGRVVEHVVYTSAERPLRSTTETA